MYVVYLIQNTGTKEKYFGVTTNLKQRVSQHNARGDKFTTRRQGTWILIYAEAYRAKEDAYKREQRLKRHASGKVELVKRLTNSLLNAKTGEGRS